MSEHSKQPVVGTLCGACYSRIWRDADARWYHVEAQGMPYDHKATPSKQPEADGGCAICAEAKRAPEDGVLERAAFRAAEEIFSLFRNASYFSTRTAEHKRQMLEGWAQIIERHCGASAERRKALLDTADAMDGLDSRKWSRWRWAGWLRARAAKEEK